MRRDPEAHGALLEILQEFPCEDAGEQQPSCADRCNDPAQKWACMRDNAWSNGMPSAIVDHWLKLFALTVARVGRNPREAYQSFTNILLEVSAASPTFLEVNFEKMVRQRAVPIASPPITHPKKSLKITSSIALPNPLLPLPSKPQKLASPVESRAQRLSTRLDALVDRIERLKERLSSSGTNAVAPHPANDPLPGNSSASSWEAGDLGDGDIFLDALEKRVARLAQRR